MTNKPMKISFIFAICGSTNARGFVGEQNWNSESGKKTLDWLKTNSLIDRKFKATQRGKAWFRYICDTPLPKHRWILPTRKVDGE